MAARPTFRFSPTRRITPTFHGVGAGVFATDPTSGEVLPLGQKFAKWLDEHPQRNWGMMMNYHPGAKIGDAGIAQFQKYRDRYVGSIAGESLGYFYPAADANEGRDRVGDDSAGTGFGL